MDEKNSFILKRSVRNSIFIGLSSLASFVIIFLFSALSVRFLGLERAGYIFSLRAITGSAVIMFGVGFDVILTYKVSNLYKDKNLAAARKIIGSVIAVELVAGLLISALVVLCVPFIFEWTKASALYKKDAILATYFFAGALIIEQIRRPLLVTYNAIERFDIIFMLSSVFGIILGVCGIVVLCLKPMMVSIAIVEFIIGLGNLICDVYFIKKRIVHIFFVLKIRKVIILLLKHITLQIMKNINFLMNFGVIWC